MSTRHPTEAGPGARPGNLAFAAEAESAPSEIQKERISPGQQRNLLVVRPTLGQGGADKVTCTLLATLDRARFRPTLVLFHRRGDWLDNVPEDVQVMDLGGHSLWRAVMPLARLIASTRPDIVFSTSGGANITTSAAHLLSRSRARLVLSERNMLVRAPHRLKGIVLTVAKALLYRRAHLVTAVSSDVAHDLRSKVLLPARRIAVVNNPIQVPDDAEKRQTAPPHHWLAEPRPVILGAGRLAPAKDFATLIRAFALLRRDHETRLIILGEGPLRSELVDLIRRLDLEHDVDLVGFRKDVASFMRRCGVFVLSSRVEGLPGVLIQAMQCGAPVVSTDCPGALEALGGRENGLVVPVGDAPAMARAIARIVADSGLRRALAGRGVAAAERFDPERILPLYEAALLGREGASR